MDDAVDIDSLLAEGSEKYGSTASSASATKADPSGVDVDSLLAEGQSKYGAPDLSKPRGTLAETGRQIAKGVVSGIPEITGKAIQAYSDEGGAVHQFGTEMREAAEERGKEYEPDLRDKAEWQKAVIRAGEAIPPSIAAALPAFIPGVGPAIAAGVTGAGFGGAQYQDTMEKLRGENIPEEQAKEAAMRTALLQGAGEIASTYLTGGVLGAGGKVAAKTVGELTGKIAKNATWKETGKQFGKAYLTDLVGEPATEIAQDVGTEAIERAYGAKPAAEYGDIAYQSGTTALAMAAMMGVPGAGGHYTNKKVAEQKAALINAGLNDPNTPAQIREATVNGIHKLAKKQGIEDADEWRDNALADVAAGRPVGSVQQPITAAAPVAEVPEAPPVVAPEAPVPPPVVADVTPQPEAEQPKPVVNLTPDQITGIDDFIKRTDDKWSALRQTTPEKAANGFMRFAGLDKAAEALGVLDPSLSAEDQMALIKQGRADIEAQKSPGQKIAEEIDGQGTISSILAANPDAIDAALQSQAATEQAHTEQPTEETTPPTETQPQGGVYVTEDGEIVGERLAEEPDYYAPDNLAQRDTLELESLISAGNLTGSRLAAANAELLRRKGESHAIEEQVAEKPDVSSGTQPGLREEGRDTAVSGPGVPPSGQKGGAVQLETPETPIPQEITDDQSQNPASEKAAAETGTEEVTESGHPKYVKANTLAEAADITEANKAALPKDQIHDGDYQRGFADFDGLHIAIENKAGSFRSGKDANGKEWRQQMHSHYGEIGVRDENGNLKTGADGDLVDVFVNPNPGIKRSPKVYIVDQVNKDGSFDEHKSLIGFASKAKAKQAYLENYEDGWTGLGAITEMSMPEFKNWLLNEDSKLPVDPNVGKPKPEPKRGPAKERINNRYQLTGNEELQKAVSKLGGLKKDGEIESVFGEYDKRALFNNGANSKYASEAVEILQGLGYQLEDEHALVKALEASLLYSSTRGQSGAQFYTPAGFENFAKRHGIEREDEGKLELESKIAELLDTAKRELPPEYSADLQLSVDRGSINLDNIKGYWDELNSDIAKEAAKREQDEGYEAGPGDLLQSQDMRGANKPKPVVKPEINDDMFVESETERQALERQQNLAAIERAKAAKRTGSIESELFSDNATFAGQQDIQDIFENVLPNKSAKEQAEARAKMEADPNAARMQYVEDNFLDLLSELEQSGKVEIKC